MSERRPTYHAHNGTTEERILTPLPKLHNAYVPATPPDTLFLLPIVACPGKAQDSESPCLQLIHLGNGDLGFCNTKTTQRCISCGSPTCVYHSWKRYLSLPDHASPDDHMALLCETCAHLPRKVLVAIFQLRESLNAEANV